MDTFSALVTELKRSKAPHIIATMRTSCVAQIKDNFLTVPRDSQAEALAHLVFLLLEHCPDTPHFELVAQNLIEDICAFARVSKQDRLPALETANKHKSPMACSLAYSLMNPLFEIEPSR